MNPPKRRGRPPGWRKRPDEADWDHFTFWLPPRAAKWLNRNKQVLLDLADGKAIYSYPNNSEYVEEEIPVWD